MTDDTAMVHRTGMRAWEWVDTHRERFRPCPEEKADSTSTAWLKPVGELALVAGVLVREGVTGSRHAASARQLLDFAWHDLLEGGDLLDRCQRENAPAPGPAEIYASFHDRGYRHPRLEESLRVLVSGLRAPSVVEISPLRRLSVATAEHQLGMRSSDDLERLLRDTWLGRLPEPWLVDQVVAYTITHTVFYLTDWGTHPDRLPAEIAEYLQLWMPVWKRDCARRRLWDLLGEWLVVDACLPDPVLDTEHWRMLASVQTPEGALPDEGDLPVGDSQAVFDAAYHPTLVTAFAATLATSRALTAMLA
ncbi:DUF6895 family protein [Actinophytocola oryzae]|uniref:DUF6895 domain-containing protein n=1 Tax=Actinophytocola oryzae TaxID=502181 RepID=A0A4R7VVM8_9PSEU|nr:hypothetical protein [Actinophytocola oryzae]TDV53932.1 hypothetical protein CLV71_104400 [Actinophytocola oryzae]